MPTAADVETYDILWSLAEGLEKEPSGLNGPSESLTTLLRAAALAYCLDSEQALAAGGRALIGALQEPGRDGGKPS